MTRKYKIIYFSSIILLLISSIPTILGKISYLSLMAFLLINLSFNKKKFFDYILILFMIVLFIINILRIDNFKEIDLVVFNFLIQIITIISIPYNKPIYEKIIYNSIKIMLIINITATILFLITDNLAPVFIDATHAKGFEGFWALKGVYSTPQILASLALFFIIFSISERKNNSIFVKIIPYIILPITLNRVNIFIGIIIFTLSKLLKRLNIRKIIIIFSLIFIISVSLLLISNIEITKINTIESRIYLTKSVIERIDFHSLSDIIFGNFTKIEFYLYRYQITKDYIENGHLFIFKYFGLIGLISYIFLSFCLVHTLFRRNKYTLAIFSFFYLFVTQLFTNEYLTIAYMQIVTLLIFSCKNNKVITDNSTRINFFIKNNKLTR
ncbi:hypothetical protein [Xenorhabdus bovienii]|uniref:hypothetical protein n=1 Tax=Xenorhabdus bovienii TaxID=40576 RepID=UPI0012D2B1A1|nr:hypothetical protein [Xenorhabdus bovienii]